MKCKDLHQKLGKRIVKLRQDRKLSQESLCFAADISVSQLRRIEHGKTEPRIRIICQISKALDTNLSELTKGL